MAGYRKLGLPTDQRKAMLRNLVTSLLKHGKIETTDTRAKETRTIAEKMITLGKRGDLHARRQVLSYVQEELVVKNLFDNVNISVDNTHIPNGMEQDSEKECNRYSELIKSLGGIDLQLLGIGHNGHIGFNEPSDSFEKQVHCVDLTESTIEANKRFFESAEDVPRQAYTMGIKTIMQAKKILLVANGPKKADVLEKALFGPVTPEVPASILQLHPDVTVVADSEALRVIHEKHPSGK